MQGYPAVFVEMFDSASDGIRGGMPAVLMPEAGCEQESLMSQRLT